MLNVMKCKQGIDYEVNYSLFVGVLQLVI